MHKRSAGIQHIDDKSETEDGEARDNRGVRQVARGLGGLHRMAGAVLCC